ncbi:MAG: dihydroorotate dehydrogenase electron transfer subunit [Oscillibacter sp.]|nr:dihydroorotate dehydrogenase electron transfer subunit [Oscillibacter sp.]
MKQSAFTLERVRPLAADTVELRFSGDTSAVTAPGQFVNLALPGRFLRRPVSVCDWTPGQLTLLLRIAGAGTRQLAEAPPGTVFDVLSGLGNGFTLSGTDPEGVILAGGGIGIAPLYGLAKALSRRGIRPVAALGFRSRADVFYLDEFRAVCETVLVATEDENGLVTDILRQHNSRHYVYCCGPLPMLRAVYGLPHLTAGQYSFEARMGCGFGACMGCSMPFRGGWRRICKDGPVFAREEIVWET